MQCKCKLCGTVNSKESDVCLKCGEDLSVYGMDVEELGVYGINVEDETMPTFNSPKKSKKRLLITVISIVLLALVGIGAFLVFKACDGDKKDPVDPKPVGPVEPVIPVADEYTTFTFEPVVETTNEDAKHDAEVIKSRFDSVGISTRYEVDGNIICFDVDKAVVDTYPQGVYNMLVLNGYGTYSGVYNEYLGALSDFECSDVKSISIEKLSIEKALTYSENLSIAVLNNVELIKDAVDGIYCLRLTLSDEDASEIKSMFSQRVENECLTLNLYYTRTKNDIETGSKQSEICVSPVNLSSPDYHDIYLFSCTFDDKGMFQNMLKSILENQKNNSIYNVFCENDIMWETQKLSGDVLEVRYQIGDYNEDFNQQDVQVHCQEVKKRLDILGVEYRFGNSRFFPNDIFAIQIRPENIDMNLLRMIGSYGRCYEFASQSEYLIAYSTNQNSVLEIGEEKGKIYAIGEFGEGFAEFFYENYLYYDEPIYAVVNGVTIGECTDVDLEKNWLFLEDIYTYDTGDAKIWELVESIDQSPIDTYYFYNISNLYSVKNGERYKEMTNNVDEIKFAYNGMTARDLETEKTVNTYGAKMSRSVSERGVLNIYLKILPTGDFAERFADQVLSIWNACELNDGSYSFIRFVSGEAKYESDACWVTFDLKNVDTDFVSEIVAVGPTYSKYQDELEEAIYSIVE